MPVLRKSARSGCGKAARPVPALSCLPSRHAIPPDTLPSCSSRADRGAERAGQEHAAASRIDRGPRSRRLNSSATPRRRSAAPARPPGPQGTGGRGPAREASAVGSCRVHLFRTARPRARPERTGKPIHASPEWEKTQFFLVGKNSHFSLVMKKKSAVIPILSE